MRATLELMGWHPVTNGYAKQESDHWMVSSIYGGAVHFRVKRPVMTNFKELSDDDVKHVYSLVIRYVNDPPTFIP